MSKFIEEINLYFQGITLALVSAKTEEEFKKIIRVFLDDSEKILLLLESNVPAGTTVDEYLLLKDTLATTREKFESFKDGA